MSRTSNTRLEFIESLRLLAALLVFFQHLIERYREIPLFDSLTRLGPGLAGVVIFFVVSGYVVPMSVKKGFDPFTFMVKRVFRVYPLLLFAFVLLLAAGLTGLLTHWSFMASAPASQWAANLMLIQDYTGTRPFLGVSWTLAIEFVWYSLFAVSLWRFGERAGLIVNLAMPLGMLLLVAASVALELRFPLGRVAMIYACILGYQAYLYDTGKITGRYLGASIAAFLLVCLISNYVAFGHFHHPRISLVQALWPWTLGPLAFFAVVLIPGLRGSNLLNRGLLPKWGAASYSIYLFHPIGMAAAEQYASNVWGEIAVAVLVTAALSAIGYRFVELSGVALGQKFLRVVSRRSAATAPPATR